MDQTVTGAPMRATMLVVVFVSSACVGPMVAADGGTAGGSSGGGDSTVAGGASGGGDTAGGLAGGTTSGGSAGGGSAGGGSAGGGSAGGAMAGGAAGGSTAGGATAGGLATGGGTSTLDLDRPLTPGTPATGDVAFEVRTDMGRRSISPLVYGSNQVTSTSRARYGLLRFGGNRLTAYNWENNASNAGSDFQFQNDGYLSSSNVPGAAVRERLMLARTHGAALMITVPIVDHVAADKNGGGDVRNSGPMYLTTRFRQNRPSSGVTPPATTPNTTDTFVSQDEFVAWARAEVGATPTLISLDNEPDLWSDTHAEIRPSALTYTELVQRTVDYARAVKAVWPTVEVTGFVSYGFNGYVNLQNAPDRAGKGEFIDYFLAQLRMAETTHGRRLVDALDVHWYPEARGGGVRIIGRDTSAPVVAARVQAPRSLWDTSYVETSWVAQYFGNQAIRLLPRLRDQVSRGYPGTKLAITEWNYGGGDHISGAVATADVLGVFGREGVEIACHWKLNGAEPFTEAGFEAFRNFDGQGGAFGDTSVRATSSQVATATIYASVDAANPARTVLVAINKETQARTATLTLAHPQAYARLSMWTLDGPGGARLVRGADVPVAAAPNGFRVTLPAMSVTVLVPAP